VSQFLGFQSYDIIHVCEYCEDQFDPEEGPSCDCIHNQPTEPHSDSDLTEERSDVGLGFSTKGKGDGNTSQA
jgi:hypothetical protein